MPGAARERGYEARPQEPHSLRQSAVTGDVPSWARLKNECNQYGDLVKIYVSELVPIKTDWGTATIN
jgi:hypothetical protein